MNKVVRYILVFFLVVVLVLVRAFQNKLFYDPFINYFKSDYLHLSFPEYKTTKLILFTFLRYFINTIISVAIIYLIYQKKYLNFTLKFYGALFVILLLLFFMALQFSSNYLFLFYVRRFLIQPIFVLLLIPAFYYQEMQQHN